jgi:hypothetical protein
MKYTRALLDTLKLQSRYFPLRTIEKEQYPATCAFFFQSGMRQRAQRADAKIANALV